MGIGSSVRPARAKAKTDLKLPGSQPGVIGWVENTL